MRWSSLFSGALTLVGAALVATYLGSLALSTQGHAEGMAAFEAARAAQQAARADGEAGKPEPGEAPGAPGSGARLLAGITQPDKSAWSATRVAEYEALLAGGEAGIPEGIMRIPSVGLELPVFAGTMEANLTRGAGRIEGTDPLGTGGNSGIAAHRDGFFRALKDVKLGDEIEVETVDAVIRYQVVDLFIVDPTDGHILGPTEDDVLTLVTCYPFYFVGSAPKRYIVRAAAL